MHGLLDPKLGPLEQQRTLKAKHAQLVQQEAGPAARTAPGGPTSCVVRIRRPGGAQLSVRGKVTSTRRFFLRPASVELSAIGYCSP